MSFEVNLKVRLIGNLSEFKTDWLELIFRKHWQWVWWGIAFYSEAPPTVCWKLEN